MWYFWFLFFLTVFIVVVAYTVILRTAYDYLSRRFSLFWIFILFYFCFIFSFFVRFYYCVTVNAILNTNIKINIFLLTYNYKIYPTPCPPASIPASFPLLSLLPSICFCFCLWSFGFCNKK